ncbi:MAG: undecaprenyl/decaprenyl-phosphate alpha-N-acetylglucosaminyl 1-phosphate transferase [Muribaculaceae bacterium]|nr:undecaprenyl/decaprenyl-phosphate alpha-N-acetylglucosaminyl 1-phosphate transferase [Muribaculaceae bacterium]
MAYWVQNYLLTLGISILLTGIIIPKILLIAFRKKLFDTVNERKIHKGVVPRLGGLAFLPALAFAFSIVVGFNLHYKFSDIATELAGTIVPIFFMICALMLIYLCGLADDLIGVRYRAKFLMQIIAGVLIIASGLWVHNFYGFLWIDKLPNWLGWIITVFGIIYIVNAVNLIDGIDGLASGLSAVALTWYSYIFYIGGNYTCMLLAGATLGTLIPFFYFNVFGNALDRTKIFMGDTGSLTIGTMLVFLAIEVFNMKPGSTPHGDNIFILAISPLLLPCFDVVRVFFHRVRGGRNPFLPDKCHIHHKLLALGMVQWQALILILGADMVLVLANVLLSPVVQPTWIILGDLVIWTLFNMLLTRLIRLREVRLDKQLYE